MIIDFNYSQKLDREVVGGKFYNLFQIKKNTSIQVPSAFCITESNFAEQEVLNRLNPNLSYAVRSSANLEDLPGLSAAGIFESYLELDSIEKILTAIRMCFEFVNSLRVKEFCRSHKLSLTQLKMQVIVQEMIVPEKSGVLFTQNPLNGQSEFVVEWVPGLGDKLVSGTATANRLIIPVNQTPSDQWSAALLETGKILEKFFDSAQDIEWAWQNNTLYLLQARPLIVLAKSIYNPSEVWTRANIGEIIPQPLTPLSWDIFSEIIYKSYRFKYYSLVDRILTNIIHLIPQRPTVVKSPQVFSGYPYLNLETILRSFGLEPWVTPKVLELGLGFRTPNNVLLPPDTFSERIIRFIKSVIFLIEYYFQSISMERRLLAFVRKNYSNYQRRVDEFKQENLYKITRFVFGWHLAATARSFSHLGFLLSRSHTKKNNEKNYLKLISWLSNLNVSAYQNEIGLLQNLGRFSVTNKQPPLPETRTKFAEERDTMEEFVKKFGHRSGNEFELAQPSWSEDSVAFREQIKNINREFLIPEINKRKPPEIDGFLAKRLTLSLNLREELKSLLVLLFRQFRKSYLKKAEKLQQLGFLNDKNDIFYLNSKEIEDLLNLKLNSLPDIFFRKSVHQDQLQKKTPFLFYQDYFAISNDIASLNKKILQGIGCSAGIATGRALILNSLDEKLNIPVNTIIITTAADPGWTPLLLQSKGMVSEVGGVLSHIATIARESGIPLITGVENITRTIQSGQIIRIDGKSGKIMIEN